MEITFNGTPEEIICAMRLFLKGGKSDSDQKNFVVKEGKKGFVSKWEIPFKATNIDGSYNKEYTRAANLCRRMGKPYPECIKNAIIEIKEKDTPPKNPQTKELQTIEKTSPSLPVYDVTKDILFSIGKKVRQTKPDSGRMIYGVGNIVGRYGPDLLIIKDANNTKHKIQKSCVEIVSEPKTATA